MGCKLLTAFLARMIFFFCTLQSITVTVAWWTGGRTAGLWGWLWIGLLPVWLFVFFRYYSIFRPGCRVCQPPEGRVSLRNLG